MAKVVRVMVLLMEKVVALVQVVVDLEKVEEEEVVEVMKLLLQEVE